MAKLIKVLEFKILQLALIYLVKYVIESKKVCLFAPAYCVILDNELESFREASKSITDTYNYKGYIVKQYYSFEKDEKVVADDK